MEQIKINDVAKETVMVLKYFEEKFTSKIPSKFILLLNRLAQESNIDVYIDKGKKLNEQNISEECKDLISLMYYSYIADGTEKKEIGKIWRQNEELYQNKLKEKFDYDNMLKNNLENKLVDNKALPAIISKPSLIQRIVKALKSFLRINK